MTETAGLALPSTYQGDDSEIDAIRNAFKARINIVDLQLQVSTADNETFEVTLRDDRAGASVTYSRRIFVGGDFTAVRLDTLARHLVQLYAFRRYLRI